MSLLWRHNDFGGVSNHQPRGCLLNCLFRRRWKKTSKLRVTGLCVGNSPGPVNSPHKGPVTRKMFPFDDVIMWKFPGPVITIPVWQLPSNRESVVMILLGLSEDRTWKMWILQHIHVYYMYWYFQRNSIIKVLKVLWEYMPNDGLFIRFW